MWSQPSQTPTRQPTIQADVSVRDRQRTGSGGGTTSSASVDDLRAFVSCAESCNSLVAEELDDLRTAWRNFRSSCSWVIVETFTRSEERRVGKECRSRWSREHEKEKERRSGGTATQPHRGRGAKAGGSADAGT